MRTMNSSCYWRDFVLQMLSFKSAPIAEDRGVIQLHACLGEHKFKVT